MLIIFTLSSSPLRFCQRLALLLRAGAACFYLPALLAPVDIYASVMRYAMLRDARGAARCEQRRAP